MRWTDWPDVDEYLRWLLALVLEIMGDDLLGLYLHGSAAMGAFEPARSDIDVLGVSHGPLSSETRRAIADAVSESALPCPGLGLEMSIVTTRSARAPSDAPAFELHVNTQGDRVVDGDTEDGDPDLVAHYAMTRARGIRLYGPEQAEVIAPVERARLLKSFAHDLAWALDGRRVGPYAVLNACRGLCYARTGELGSKPEGGAWAIAAGEVDPALVAAALSRQHGGDDIEAVVATSFVERVRIELLQQASA
jgi:streptomycin 3"-adenylyltransferase